MGTGTRRRLRVPIGASNPSTAGATLLTMLQNSLWVRKRRELSATSAACVSGCSLLASRSSATSCSCTRFK